MSPDDHHDHAVPPPGTLMDDKYVVGEVLAKGGMGCLVKAQHALMQRSVAIKFVLRSSSRAARDRMLREARALQTLRSDYVVQVFDLGIHDEAPYIVMELLDGADLGEIVANAGPLPLHEAVDCAIEAGAALVEAHAAGIVHRDVKPPNLFLAETRGRRRIKLLDFGISKLAPELRDEDLEKTAEDSVLGTPFYMSPEQIRNPTKIDARADVWSLAVTLFHLLTGEHPFVGETAREVTGAIFTDPPRHLPRGLPSELDEAIHAALAKRPEERTESVVDFVDALVPFASKRGRDAAESIAAIPPAEPRTARATTSADASLGTTADALSTEDALSTAQPTTADRDRTTVAARAPQPKRLRVVWIVTGAAAAVGLWVMTQRESPGPAARPSAVATTVRSAPSPIRSASTMTSAEPPTSTVAPTALATTAAATAKPAKSAPPMHVSPPVPSPKLRARPVTTSAPSASPSGGPAVDIDGVPIVE